MRAEGQPGEFGDFARGAFGEFEMGVEAGADGSAADGEIVEAVESDGDAATIAVKHIDVAGKFLAERERRGVLQVAAGELEEVRESFRFSAERGARRRDGAKKPAGGLR